MVLTTELSVNVRTKTIFKYDYLPRFLTFQRMNKRQAT